MIEELDFKLVYVFSKKVDLLEVMKIADVRPNSYSGELVTRLHEMFFGFGTDLLQEYKDYYSLEYGNPFDFLFWKYALPMELVNRIYVEVNSGKQFVGITKHNIYIFHEKEMVDLVTGLFEKAASLI